MLPEWITTVTSLGLGTAIVIAIGFAIRSACKWASPMFADLYKRMADALIGHTRLMDTLGECQIKQADVSARGLAMQDSLLAGQNVHSEILKDHAGKLTEHGAILRELRDTVVVRGCGLPTTQKP